MKKQKPISFYIDCGVYPFDVFVYIGEDKTELYKTLEDYLFKKDFSEYKEHDIGNGRSTMFSDGESVLYLQHIPITPFDRGTLAHEIFHTVDHLMNRIGIKLSEDSNEAYAYLIGYITTKIYEKLKTK